MIKEVWGLASLSHAVKKYDRRDTNIHSFAATARRYQAA
jgi:hypothetical protein